MALPELLVPAGIPCFLLAPHGISPDAWHDDLSFKQGHGRARQIYTTAPRYADVSLDLSAAQAATLEEWMQNALTVLDAKFTAEVAPIGAASRYWAAQWVDPPRWTPRAAKGAVTRWRLEGRLRLTGEGSDTKPLGGVLSTLYRIDLRGSASLTAAIELDTEYTIELLSVTSLSTLYLVNLEVDDPSYFEREDSGFIERESGGFLQRE